MNLRTDLISEHCEGKNRNISGIKSYDEKIGESILSTVEITDEYAANLLHKPIGCYCTVEFERLDRVACTRDIIKAVVSALKKLIPNDFESSLIVGLGNTDITPDALGPFVTDGIIATRHISSELKSTLGLEGLKSVSCLVPGVLGKTGIEAFDIVSATVRRTKPSVIIAIDALAARSPERLCRTVQLSNTGITPGSGVNNARKELSQKTFGIPVICVGVPTVIDANGLFENKNIFPKENMMVTPKEIDLLIEKSASMLSRALNIFLQPNLDEQIIDSLA